MSKILVFDLGTSYIKVCLFDESGSLVGLQRVATPAATSTEGLAEVGISAFRQTLLKATHGLAKAVDGLSDVAAVCFATQTNSFLVLDRDNLPLSPILLWSDQRAKTMENPLAELLSTARFRSTTGVPTMTHEFMPLKIHWMKSHQQAVFEKIARVALVSDYLTWWMTGNHVTEAGVAGLTGLTDIHELEWWPDAYQQVEIQKDWLPEIVRAGTDIGTLQPEVAKEFGLPPTCRFIVGCLDQYAGAIGAGNVKPEGVSETTGTVLATVRCSAEFVNSVPEGVFQGPTFAAGQYFQMIFGDISAGILEKFRDSLNDRPSFEELDALAECTPSGCDGLKLHPDSPSRKGEDFFLNLSDHHTRGHQVRAIYEAVASALCVQVNTLCGVNRPKVVHAVGGAARSKLLLQIKSELLGCEVRSVACPEPTSLGAARLAMSTLSGRPMKTLCQHWGGNPRESS